jgi:hypothetical protein
VPYVQLDEVFFEMGKQFVERGVGVCRNMYVVVNGCRSQSIYHDVKN